MRTLSELYLQADRIEALAELVIPWCLKGAVVLLLAGVASWLLRRSSARARHLAWALSVVTVMVLPALQGFLPPIAVPAPLPAGDASTGDAVLVLDPTPHFPRDSSACPHEAALPPGSEDPPAAAAGQDLPASPGASAVVAGRVAAAPAAGSRLRLGPLGAFILWLLGLVAVLSSALPGWLHRRRLEAEAEAAPDALAARVDELRRELGISRPVRTLAGSGPMPLTWGTLRPVIYLPRSAAGWPGSRLRHVLLHELAHVASCDALLFRVARVLCALRWFDPLTWYAARRLRIEAEHACDERVLLADGRPALYAGHLLESLREARNPRSIAAIALARRSQLSERIEGILSGARHRPTGRALLLGAVGALAIVGLISSLTLAAPAAPPELPAPPPDPEWAWASVEAPEPPAAPERPASPGAAPDPAPAPHPAPEPRPATPVVAATAPAPPTPPASVRPVVSGHVSIHETDDGAGGFFDHPDYRGLCDGGWLGTGQYGYRVDVHDDEWDIRIDHAGCRLDVEMEGDVRLGLVDGGIQELGRGARVRIAEDTGGASRTLEVTPARSGARYVYRVDDRERPLDAAARQWLGRVTTELFRITGLRAEERVAAILEGSGVDGVLGETAHISSDFVHRTYLQHLFAQARPSEAETRRALEQAAGAIGSDFEMAELLIALAPRVPWSSGQEAYVQAATTVGSDFEARRVVEALVGAQELGPRTLRTVLQVAASIGSDFEMAEALLAIERQWPVAVPLDPALFTAVGTIGSDFEARRVLDAVSERDLDAGQWTALLEAAGDIGSDFEMAELLVRIARRTPGPLPRTYFEAVRTIGSDFEAQRVLRAALEHQDLEEGELLDLLAAARTIGSDHELAELLVATARRYAMEGLVRTAFLEASQTIGSSYDRGRVLLALESR